MELPTSKMTKVEVSSKTGTPGRIYPHIRDMGADSRVGYMEADNIRPSDKLILTYMPIQKSQA
jgi:hypothetical protein